MHDEVLKNRNYKSAHSIGSRKATEKVITYNETLPFFPEMVQLFWSGKHAMDGKKRPAVKRKTPKPASDASSEKKVKRDVKAQVVVAKKVTHLGKESMRGDSLEVGTPKKNENPKADGDGQKNDSDKKIGRSLKTDSPKDCVKKIAGGFGIKKDLPGKEKKTFSPELGGKTKPSPGTKAGKEVKSLASKKTTKPRKEEREIPSLKSFLKPKREASLFAAAMVNIIFERLPPPKKESCAGTRSKKSSAKPLATHPNSSRVDEGTALASKVKKKPPTKRAAESSKLCKAAKVPASKTKKSGTKKSGGEAERVQQRKPKTRMASLNARALIVAERESLKLALERAARTDRYCVSWKHTAPPAARPPGMHHDAARWVDGRGDTCCVDASLGAMCVGGKQDLQTPAAPGVAPPAVSVADVKSAMGAVHLALPSSALRDKDMAAVSDDRPSSVVDVVGAHTPSKAPLLTSTSCLNSYGGLFPQHAPCLSPCPGYSYSHTEGYVTPSGYQSFTLSGIGTLGGLSVVAPTYRTSAFSVPYNTPLPYGYYPGGYYQPASATPLLPQPIAQTCLLAHHIPVRVPHAKVKVLIHNPDTPHDLAAFSDPTCTGKSSDSNNNSSSITNYISNNSKIGSSARVSSVSKFPGNEANAVTSATGAGKKRTSADAGRSKSVSGKKKTESRVELKNRDNEKGCKRKYEKKKIKASKPEVEAQVREQQEVKKEEAEIAEHGWSWVGEPKMKKVPSVNVETPPIERHCYKAIRHVDGDLIQIRDCVLLRSGSRKSDVPYVAKVAAFWEHPDSGEMMMSLLWYYQPEHTETGRQQHDLTSEVFASRHWDENSVACIDDKCYVLTYDQYCRYQGEMRRRENNALPRSKVVPALETLGDSQYDRELPDHDVDPENVFMCRKVYDFRQKRILKNPS